jgi:hypothetical protein
MTIKMVFKLFTTTSLLFLAGFILVLLRAVITDTSINNLVYFITQIIYMVLSGAALCLITKWKSLKFSKPIIRRKNPAYITSLKLRSVYIAAFAVIALFCTNIQWNFLHPLLTAIDNLFFPGQFHYFFLKFVYIASSLFTFLFVFILAVSYLLLEFLFSRNTVVENSAG